MLPVAMRTQRLAGRICAARACALAGVRAGVRGWVLAGVSGLLVGLSGCTTTLQVQALATGRSDMSAHALTGGDLDTLRREAQRLCPLGGEILRQSGRPPPAQPTGSRWRVLLGTTAQWIDTLDTPQPSAQLVVLCREPGDRARLPATAAQATDPPPTTAARPANTTQATAALPIGPITPEW